MMAKLQRRPPGRPLSINVDLELYGYVRGELAKGRTLSNISEGGFAVYSQVAPGEFVLLRRIKGQHLEAMYRAIEERNRPPFAKRVCGQLHGTPVFSDGMASLEVIGTVPPLRRPGRPKEFRSR